MPVHLTAHGIRTAAGICLLDARARGSTSTHRIVTVIFRTLHDSMRLR